MYFRPLTWLTLFSGCALLILLALGFWQLDRLAWKTALIENFESRAKAPAIMPPPKDAAPMEFTRLRFDGHFLHAHEIYLNGRTYEGNAGFHVITPFRLADDRLLFVNRGWVSEQYRLPSSRPFSLSNDKHTLHGILRLPQSKGRFVPENDPEQGWWFTINPPEIAQHLGLHEAVQSYYVDQIRQSPIITLPIAAEIKIDIRNAHLNYALTWFGIALALLAIYTAYHISLNRLGFKRKG